MPTDRPRYTVSVTNEMFELIETFRFENRFQTRSEATAELIRIGLEQLQKEQLKQTQKTQYTTIQRPFYPSAASAGNGSYLLDDEPKMIDLPDTPLARQSTIVVRVSGDSMEPDYLDGNMVLVQTDTDLNIGDVGIFILDGEGYIKKLGDSELISVNPEYEPIPITPNNELRIIGKVIGKL